MLSLTLACAFLACTQPLPTTPDEGPLLAPTAADIKLTYICGNSFRLRNSSADTVTVRYDVYGTTETGPVFLPGRPAGALYSETYFTTTNKGTVRVFLGTQLVQTKANGNKPPCTLPSDTTRPALTGPPQYPSPALFAPLPGSDSVGVRRDVIQVFFQSTATGSQIRAFLARIGATVIGGEAPPIGDGGYFVRVPDLGATIEAVDSMKAILSADPIVVRIWTLTVGGRIDVRGLFPDDGGFTRRIDWRKVIGSAPTGTNPRLLINAPLAWGCSNGLPSESAPLVGIIDLDFGSAMHPDLPSGTQVSAIPSTTPMVRLPLELDTALYAKAHALSAAGIIGAVGDNGVGTVGVLWGAPLRLFPIASGRDVVSDPALRYGTAIRTAKLQGVRVLSVSVSPDAGVQSLRDAVDRYKFPLQEYLADSRNLLVVATGNANAAIPIADVRSGVSPLISAFDRAVAELLLTHGSQIIMVAGSDRDGDLWFNQSFNGVIRGSTIWVGATDLIAPATFVQSLAPTTFPDGLFVQQFGTSFAAPFVAGTAALVMMAAPMLTASEVRAALIEGAADPRTDNLVPGERVARDFGTSVGQSHLYHLDAYNALRRAAQTSGTPLCGNRLWAEGNKVFAARGTAAPELIATMPHEIGSIVAFHGGRKLAVSDVETWDWKTFELSNGTWQDTGPWDESLEGVSGAGMSVFGLTHDRDSVAYHVGWEIWMGTSYGQPGRLVGQLPPPTFTSTGGSEVCTKERKNDDHWDCYDTVVLGTTTQTSWRGDVTVLGETALLFTQDSTRSVMTVGSTWYDCFTLQPATDASGCRYKEFGATPEHLGSALWRMQRDGGAVDPLVGVPGRFAVTVSGSEAGSQLAVTSGGPLSNGRLSDCSTQFYVLGAAGAAQADGPAHPFGPSCESWIWQGGFGAVRQQLTTTRAPSTRGFALQSRLLRAARR